MRIAVTDRCNLRCAYCMPAEGIKYMPKIDLLSFEEIIRVAKVFAQEGITKLRITGGEPFLRKDMMALFRELFAIDELNSIHLTTNGTLIIDHLAELKQLGLKDINLSLDSLDKDRFQTITRRDDFEIVQSCMDQIVELGFQLKINMVVMNGQNIEDLYPMIELTKNKNISVRFLEEMPFNGTNNLFELPVWNHNQILNHIKSKYPKIEKIASPKSSTSVNYKIEGYQGSFGIIAAFTRNFCGSCNRIRLTPQGMIKTCLYDSGVFNVRDLMRAGATNQELKAALKSALSIRAKDGHEAEKNRKSDFESMATIGG